MSDQCNNKCCTEHQAPSGEYNHTDYSEKMPELIFRYDQNFFPTDDSLPDPQVDPVIPGARVPLDKVGIAPVDLPIRSKRRDGDEPQVLQSQASLYCSLDDPNAKGLNLSRLYLLMHDKIEGHLSVDGVAGAVKEMAEKQGAKNAYCKLRFKYPWTQKALRSRQPLTDEEIEAGEYEVLENGEKISLKKLEGHIAYDTILEARYHADDAEKYTEDDRGVVTTEEEQGVAQDQAAAQHKPDPQPDTGQQEGNQCRVQVPLGDFP